jgi:hypothetical protein
MEVNSDAQTQGRTDSMEVNSDAQTQGRTDSMDANSDAQTQGRTDSMEANSDAQTDDYFLNVYVYDIENKLKVRVTSKDDKSKHAYSQYTKFVRKCIKRYLRTCTYQSVESAWLRTTPHEAEKVAFFVLKYKLTIDFVFEIPYYL